MMRPTGSRRLFMFLFLVILSCVALDAAKAQTWEPISTGITMIACFSSDLVPSA